MNEDDFLSWDDARLGKLCKEMLVQLQKGGNSNSKLFAVQAGMLIIAYMVKTDISHLSLLINGFTNSDLEHKTDWTIKIGKNRTVWNNVKAFFKKGE